MGHMPYTLEKATKTFCKCMLILYKLAGAQQEAWEGKIGWVQAAMAGLTADGMASLPAAPPG